MRKIFKNRCVFGLVSLIVVVSAIVGVVNATKADVTFTENVVQVVFTPLQKLFTKIGNGVSDFLGYFSDVNSLKKEIEDLKLENAQLKSDIDKNESKALENDELRQLLSLRTAYPELELKSAEVIARDVSNRYNTFVVDKGAIDGVAVNQAVISANNALVGKISEVGTTWARVVTINDPGNFVGAEVVRSGEYGIVEGESLNISEGSCRLSLLPKNANVVVGDRVVTAGLGGVYPKGLTIGKILEIRPDVQGISQYALVTPEANLSKLRFVMIVMNDMNE